MIDCPKCKASIDNDSWYCDQCGQELKVCPQCRTYGKGNRCTQCGSILTTAKERDTQNSSPNVISQNANNDNNTTLQQPVNNLNVSQPIAPPANTNGEATVRKPTVNIDSQTAPVLFCQALQARLQAQAQAIIGRKNGPYVNVFGSQAYVSGTHARFDATPNGWTVTDLDSTNGTFYNNIQLQPNVPCRIFIGGKLKIADIEFVVEK